MERPILVQAWAHLLVCGVDFLSVWPLVTVGIIGDIDAALIVGLPGLSVGIILVVFHNYAWYMEGVQRSIDSSPRYFNTIDGITSVPITFDFFVLRIAVHRTKIVPFCCFRLRFLADFLGPNGAVGGVRFGELPIEKCFGIFSGGKPVCS